MDWTVDSLHPSTRQGTAYDLEKTCVCFSLRPNEELCSLILNVTHVHTIAETPNIRARWSLDFT